MPVFRVILKDAESGEFRDMAAAADSQDEAVASAEEKEQKHVNFIGDPGEIAELEQKLKNGSLTGRDKARLLSHRQEKAYKVSKVSKL